MTDYVVSYYVPQCPSSVDASSEPTCCDGSDESAGVCENTCVAAGKLYRQKQKSARKLQSTVSVEMELAFQGFNKVCRDQKFVRHILPSHGKRRNGWKARLRAVRKRLRGVSKSLPALKVCSPHHIVDISHLVTDLVDRTEALSAEVLEHMKESRTS